MWQGPVLGGWSAIVNRSVASRAKPAHREVPIAIRIAIRLVRQSVDLAFIRETCFSGGCAVDLEGGSTNRRDGFLACSAIWSMSKYALPFDRQTGSIRLSYLALWTRVPLNSMRIRESFIEVSPTLNRSQGNRR